MQEAEVNSDLEYLVLATDGLWDVVRNEVSNLAHAHIRCGEHGLVSFTHLILSIAHQCFVSFTNKDIISLMGATDGTEAAAMKLTELAYSRHSSDNITCIVVRFHR